MARPQDKKTLLEQAQQTYHKMNQLIDSMNNEQQEGIFPFEDRDKNIRDVLIHLYEWQQLLLKWVQANHVDNQPTAFLPKPYNWRTYGEMNISLWEKHQHTSLEEAKRMLKESHQKVIDWIQVFTNDELFTKKYFSWTGSTSLGSYCISATSSHYNWAMKKIRRYKKTLKN
ncbi:ClbS/DfsB family four-helix bundle protein [Amphibacillus sp. Q70]|uniref:ClbS/DfsB family four-helix bundle protein n=1 Tax=Amphibacillus sp. Q70 TaxID=3453416 RepID=UPI003F834D2C